MRRSTYPGERGSWLSPTDISPKMLCHDGKKRWKTIHSFSHKTWRCDQQGPRPSKTSTKLGTSMTLMTHSPAFRSRFCNGCLFSIRLRLVHLQRPRAAGGARGTPVAAGGRCRGGARRDQLRTLGVLHDVSGFRWFMSMASDSAVPSQVR